MALRNKIAGASLAGLLAVSALFVSPAGEQFVKKHEGLEQVAYLDAVNIWTICWGSTTNVRPGSSETLEQCEARLRKDLEVAAKAVRRLVKQELSQSQFDSLVSFVFNVGSGNFASSTLLKNINAGQCYAAAVQFDRWVYAKKKVLRGLQIRRAQERGLFEKDCHLWDDVSKSRRTQSPHTRRLGDTLGATS